MKKRPNKVTMNNKMILSTLLKQPPPMILKEGNLLETYGCTPGPGIRENAKLMMQPQSN